MTSDLSHLTSVFPLVVESIFMSSSLAVILIDWNHSCLETSLLRALQSYLPRWRNRNIRQKTYLCLFGISLAIMYTNSMINFSINMENFRIAITSIVVLLSFWFQSKTNSNTLSNQIAEFPKVQVSHKTVGRSPVTLRDQGTSASTCCGARIPQYPLSLPTSSVPQPEVNVEEEMKEPYVLAFRSQFDLEEVSEEKLATAIRYLNTLRGGIEAHRDSNKLMNAVDHIDSMRSRLDDSGFPQEYSYEELHHIVVEENKYPFEDFERVVGKCLENSGFLPSPDEFAEIHHDMKGIVQLEREVAETRQEMEETSQALERTQREVTETSQALERTQRVVEETTQVVVESQQQNMSLRQRLQQKERALLQKDQTIQQKDRIIQLKERLLHQEIQRVRELEQNPEGVLQKLVLELKEENRRLSAQSKRALCKICHDKEVQVSFYPCKHLISCEGCVDGLPEKTCPVCRKPIEDTIKMFFA